MAHERPTDVALFPKTSENLLDIDTLSIHLRQISIVERYFTLYDNSINALIGKNKKYWTITKTIESKKYLSVSRTIRLFFFPIVAWLKT